LVRINATKDTRILQNSEENDIPKLNYFTLLSIKLKQSSLGRIERSPAERDLGILIGESWTRAGNVRWQPRGPTVSWAASRAAWPAGRKR